MVRGYTSMKISTTSVHILLDVLTIFLRSEEKKSLHGAAICVRFVALFALLRLFYMVKLLATTYNGRIVQK